ncbi:MAG: universal stress protein [Saprospiraceae bacterium]|nr:universal stress protein [Lewinella sp.]
MKKILFATEFSDHAPDIFRYAAELAYFFKADLLAMHAFGHPGPRIETKDGVSERHDRVIEKLVNFVAGHLPEAYRKKIHVDYLAVNSYPIDGILEVALDQDIELIVMGMTGKTNALGSILGNTTLNVLAKADCQVLIIPEKTHYKGIENIVYTTDFEFRDLEAIHYLKRWRQLFDASIHALHVYEGDENEFAVLKNMMLLKETFSHQRRLDFDLRYGELREEVEKFAKSKDADLVAMISHKRNFLSRVLDINPIEGIAKEIDIPLLVIKNDAYQIDQKGWEWVELARSFA